MIEADFQQYYGLDVSDAGVSRHLTYGRLERLLLNLPVQSRFCRKYLHPDSVVDYPVSLLRSATHSLAVANWQRAGDNRVSAPDPPSLPSEILDEYQQHQERVKILIARRDAAKNVR